MQFLRLGPVGDERPAVRTDDGTTYDLLPITPDIDGAFLANDGVNRVRAALESGELEALSTEGVRVGSPLAHPGKVICIGLNYRDHAEETGAAIPGEPVMFLKTPDTIVGPYDEVLVPRRSVKTDWEVELGVVIGRTARYLESEEDALACVGAYVLSHDVSEREFQIERGGTWDKGKNCETFNPLGPFLVPADEIADPQSLDMRLWVNGEIKQNSSTKNMIFPVAEIVRYLSQFLVLRPGDVINTGTPAGVALGQPEPKPYLRAGDVVELEIEGLGRQRQILGQA
ncbi:2-keto-4-pentenoate hydratase/2-oxohepta-3-ene-1,7-dioic acid hydratase (catechol pathway) [Lentzea albidocapillata subsp. violacea]|uniref:2-keto-4-pentenoate hydratase/2-oxohepta-3-ene-1,7-dioic acid hydratase (Catechol pathway) n=1 Tax=Lentzea albidocapillata subsp. violacea TaxID=128104 RepID=A0A1G9I507_9PSEU|nr:fumarylacetoacetate hydrolase family protein [Lentzea albidocapillata]SDL20156.1 2-keto-4-pentenoate hydratase/2-oxohepta-3-ene-1,7-dioic acid hydratase (catechol pathway) [Lentzea albidocapillata subsp. violacea]